ARMHAGQDFAAAAGTPVFATAGGVVLSAGWGGGYGNLVQVDHGNGLVTRYAHLSEILVSQGQPVAVGARVGLVGSTGRSTGAHLH
uniref:M23 family metallopeptidase n=1 Tax=Klebsiella oxytoca TaxID=571 RepID=UPI0013D5985F